MVTNLEQNPSIYKLKQKYQEEVLVEKDQSLFDKELIQKNQRNKLTIKN